MVMDASIERGRGPATHDMKTRSRGRPVEKPMPAPIPDTPENVARALLTTSPKDDGGWDYLKERQIEVADALLRRRPKDK